MIFELFYFDVDLVFIGLLYFYMLLKFNFIGKIFYLYSDV